MIEPIVDVSTWQKDINKEKMLGAGTLGMYIRAGSINGTPYTDYQFYNNAEKFNGEVPCGYYWFFRPEFSPSVQAAHFVKLMNSVRVDLPPVVDIESNYKKVSMGIFQENAGIFIELVDKLMNKSSVIYTRGSFWNQNVGSPLWASKYRLWIAMYNETIAHPWIGSSSYYRPKPWGDFWMWQYSADKNGRGAEFGVATSGIDINRYNGTLDEFYRDANWEQVPDPPNRFCKVLRAIKSLVDKALENCDG